MGKKEGQLLFGFDTIAAPLSPCWFEDLYEAQAQRNISAQGKTSDWSKLELVCLCFVTEIVKRGGFLDEKVYNLVYINVQAQTVFLYAVC